MASASVCTCTVIVLLVSIGASVLCLRLDSSNSTTSLNLAQNPIWRQFQPKLVRLVDSFERVCRSLNVASFNRGAVEAELKSCFRAPIRELTEIVTSRDTGAIVQLVTIVEKLKPGASPSATKATAVPSISQAEIELLRVHMVEPICFFTSSILDCFSPHYSRIIEQCTSDPEGKAMQYSDQIVIAVCKNNGSRLIGKPTERVYSTFRPRASNLKQRIMPLDFLETGGIECIGQYFNSTMDCLNKQSMSFSDSMDLLKYKRQPDSLTELCGDLTDIHSCLTTSLSSCGRSEPTRIIRTMLNEVHEWTVGACLSSGSSEDKSKAHAYSHAGENNIGLPFITMFLILPVFRSFTRLVLH